jgi:hypothetical protein
MTVIGTNYILTAIKTQPFNTLLLLSVGRFKRYSVYNKSLLSVRTKKTHCSWISTPSAGELAASKQERLPPVYVVHLIRRAKF